MEEGPRIIRHNGFVYRRPKTLSSEATNSEIAAHARDRALRTQFRRDQQRLKIKEEQPTTRSCFDKSCVLS
jgi:hypothetical protein